MKLPKKDVKLLEIEENELIKVSILKRELITLFENYKKSRQGVITFLFRNSPLTKEKLAIVDEVIDYIKRFEGTKEELLEGMKRKRIENAETSRKYGKFHFNLLERRQGYSRERGYFDIVKKGEAANQSGLATVFHDAIKILSLPDGCNHIKNCFS